MIKNIIASLTGLLFFVAAHAQLEFKDDNTVYKNIYAKDLCALLKKNPNALLIDVRSPGEYSDTSSMASMNIGHLKGAINIPINNFPAAIDGLKNNADQPVILYCSHSQRSRRVSKMLADNGFTHVLNLNGGMTALNQDSDEDFPCKKEMIVYASPYKNIDGPDAVKLIKNDPDLLVIDTRSAMTYAGKDSVEENNVGRIRHSLNIPADELAAKWKKPASSKAVLVVDNDNGSESAVAAKWLTEHGYTNVYSLTGGLWALVGQNKNTMADRKAVMEALPAYSLLNPKETMDLLTANPATVVLDLRPAEDFKNKSDKRWHNLGHIRNAINIPPAQFAEKMKELEPYKKTPILLYGNDDPAKYCRMLTDAGFENVNIIYDGLWSMVSGAANFSELQGIRPLLTDHEGLY